MYICKPERNIKQVKLLLVASVIVTAVMFFAATVASRYASIVKLAAFISLIAAIFLNIRYSLTEFEYTVGNGDFSIFRITGNRRQQVCCIALESAVELMTKRDYDHLPSGEKGIIKYSLKQNMFASSYVFLCNFNGKRAMIEFEPNEAFVSVMKSEIEAAKK